MHPEEASVAGMGVEQEELRSGGRQGRGACGVVSRVSSHSSRKHYSHSRPRVSTSLHMWITWQAFRKAQAWPTLQGRDLAVVGVSWAPVCL